MKKLLCLIIVLVFLVPKTAFALSCVEFPGIETAYKEYDAVIIGHVEDITRGKQSSQVQLKVLKSFKGIEEEIISASEDSTWGTSQVGETSVLFLNKAEKGWEISLCAPHIAVSNATKELAFLQNKEIPLKKTTQPEKTESSSSNTYWIISSVFLVLLILFVVRMFIRSKSKRN